MKAKSDPLWLGDGGIDRGDIEVGYSGDFAVVKLRDVFGKPRGSVKVFAADLREIAKALGWKP